MLCALRKRRPSQPGPALRSNNLHHVLAGVATEPSLQNEQPSTPFLSACPVDTWTGGGGEGAHGGYPQQYYMSNGWSARASLPLKEPDLAGNLVDEEGGVIAGHERLAQPVG